MPRYEQRPVACDLPVVLSLPAGATAQQVMELQSAALARWRELQRACVTR